MPASEAPRPMAIRVLPTLPAELDEPMVYLSDRQTTACLKVPLLAPLVDSLPCWVSQRFIGVALRKDGGINRALAAVGRPFVWATEFENVHSMWRFDEPQLEIDGNTYQCSESYYHTCKPRPFNEAAWAAQRESVMRRAVRAKLEASPEVCRLLVSTHPHPLLSIKDDDVWGFHPSRGGQNLLARVYEDFRAELVAASSAPALPAAPSLSGQLHSFPMADPRPSPAAPAAHMLAGTHEQLDGVEAVWELPQSAIPRAIVLLCHGACHSATDFWPPSRRCPSCVGLPEEVRIVRDLLVNGYAAIALSSSMSQQRVHPKAWAFDVDGPRVVGALKAFRKQHVGLEALPLVAFGVSSGGKFVQLLPQLARVACVVSQIMALPPAHLAPATTPTLFVWMSRDADGPIRTTTNLSAAIADLRRRGVPVHDLEATPLAITPLFFADAIKAMPPEASREMHARLTQAGLLDAKGHLRDDPRSSPWREALRTGGELPASPPADSLVADESPIAEMLNTAYAQHEIRHLCVMEETLAWLETVC